MTDDAKIDAVRDYLVREFPTLTPVVFPEQERGPGTYFRLDENGVRHHAIVTLEFLRFCAAEDILAILERFGLAEALREAGQSYVIVMPNGLRIEE